MFYYKKIFSSSNYISLLIALIVVIFVSLYFYFIKFDSNITGFFRIGSILPLSLFLNPENTLIYQGEIGYDGQQFFKFSFLTLFLQNPETVNSLDHPIYRYRRIFISFGKLCFSFW
ncbi:hypothetical protein CWATWH0402_4405 [Crocosphaera watsonii WH 0402]|uniref:Uncharacterized protein n=1 Tax=Crocosphaera watsonii WH 0402 TaxID=1284629 RepID=T2JW74_CROWT|nr:hypothetical protein [Crocosphaera watsonii]CCQ69465.1 hypothetical protein CWATWH0402_4405 [Crocosphaera watsonii WH 0402]